MTKIYLGLIHHPVLNKWGETVTTSVTNLDIHDIARSCCSYGVDNYKIITPVFSQHKLLDRILNHWKRDESQAYNPHRFEALDLVSYHFSLEEALGDIEDREGGVPLVAVTGARMNPWDGGVEELRERVAGGVLFLLFGTGHGLVEAVLERADFRLKPLAGRSPRGYNHLSVRSAVAIYLDRLCSGL